MNRVAILLLAAALPSGTLALAPPVGPWLVGDAGRGRTVFLERGRCVECHRFDGQGRHARGPSLEEHWAVGAGLPERLAERPRPEGYEEGVPGDAYLLESLLDPGAWLVPGYEESMPEAGGPMLRLGRQDLADLLAYLNPAGEEARRWIPELPEPGPDPWAALPQGDVARGEALFFRPDDASCSGCHVVRLPRLQERFHGPFWRQSGLAGPELTRAALLLTPAEILEAVLRPNRVHTSGYRNVVAETEGERLFVGLLLARGEPGLLLMEASPSGPEYLWLDADSVAEVHPVEESRMTHVFPELLSVGERLDLLAFLRRVALESAELGEDGLPGRLHGARDPAAHLYHGRWPAEARPELLQRIAGIHVIADDS